MLAKLLPGLLALLVGAGLPLQSAINAALARHLGSALLASTISFMVGTLALLLASLAMGQVAGLAGVRAAPVPIWLLGGLLGAGFVLTATFLVPRIGTAALVAFAITGQLIAAAIIDHYGVLGVPEQAFTWSRALGIALLVAGAVLVRFA